MEGSAKLVADGVTCEEGQQYWMPLLVSLLDSPAQTAPEHTGAPTALVALHSASSASSTSAERRGVAGIIDAG